MEPPANLYGYRANKCWQIARKLGKVVYERTLLLPKSEQYGLFPQMRRSAVSVSINIAEGYGRRTTGEYLQFLGIARGSLRELEACAFLCMDLGYLPEDDPILPLCDEVARIMWGLEKALEEKLARQRGKPKS